MNDTRWRKPDSILHSPFGSETLTVFGTFTRILLILVVALAAHGVALGARALGRRLLRTRVSALARAAYDQLPGILLAPPTGDSRDRQRFEAGAGPTVPTRASDYATSELQRRSAA